MIFSGGTRADYRGPTEVITLLAKACYEGDLNYVKTHIKVDDTLNPETLYHALTFASLGSKLSVVKFLLSVYPPRKWTTVTSNYHVGSEEQTSLFPIDLADDMIRNDDAALLRCYLEAGLDPNWQLHWGSGVDQKVFDSLLYLCSVHPECLEVLIEYGVDVSRPGINGLRSPVYCAAENNEVKCLQLLLDNGAPSRFALWGAARSESLEAVNFLLERKLDINEHNIFDFADRPSFLGDPDEDHGKESFDGGTALHAAIIPWTTSLEDFEGANLDMAKFLVGKGASLDERDQFGKTPYDHALECKFYRWSQEDIEFFKPNSR